MIFGKKVIEHKKFIWISSTSQLKHSNSMKYSFRRVITVNWSSC